jgi:phage-related protein
MANSTVSSLSGTTYVDLEIAEAYVMTGSGPESANGHVIIGAEVPVLVPGANEITYDNTITSLQIIPRWWKI